MLRIGVRELRQNASRYLAQVKAGETVEVTERGVLIARLVPPQPADSARDRLVAAGRLIPALRPWQLPRPKFVEGPPTGIDHRLVGVGRTELAVLDVVPLDAEVLAAAAELPDPGLRSLDALHLASALALDPDLEVVVAYGARLVAAARAVGLDVVHPGR